MRKTLYRYNTGHFFETGLRIFGWIVTLFALFTLVFGTVAAAYGYVAAWLMLPVGIITQFTHYYTEFDLQQKTYTEGVRFANITFGDKLPLPGFDFLFLKQNKYRQSMESASSLKVIKYDGYVKLSNNVKLHLVQYRKKEKAMQEMERISHDLQVELRDLTGLII